MSVDRSVLTEQVMAVLARFSSDSRLYGLTIGDGKADLGSGGLLVEAFAADDAVQGIGGRDVIVVSTDAHVALPALLGQAGKLDVTLADGKRVVFAGDVTEAAMLGSEGGLARYRVRLSPWVWRLSQVRNSRVWQDQSVIAIVDQVFAAYMPLARWRWSEEAGPFMEYAVARSYCCQYRETDLDFVLRLLSEEGLAWRFDQDGDGPEMVLFADSRDRSGVPDDISSAAAGGIRFHAVRSGEQQDTVQALQAQRRVVATLSTVLSYDYKAKQVVAAHSPSRLLSGSKLPALENFDHPGQYAYTNAAQARRYADLQMQAREARSALWRGRSTVRTLRAGTRMTILNGPLQQHGDSPPAYTILRVLSVGVNNLPSPAQQALAELFGPIPELLQERIDSRPEDFALAIAEARKSGYANCFEAIASETTWRPELPGSDARSHPRPTAPGAQSAIVIGADGNDRPHGADELYCDKLGRVRIRYHWQSEADATCWVRVAQRSAGGGMGLQFLPRIGQEVLVQFIENDIDRPLIVGALYNGQGEGGIAPTPGGDMGGESEPQRFHPAHDHATSAQGNLAGGHSPLWHGASNTSAGHRNSAAQWGVRSKEFGGPGYNQLLFDDTDTQGRIQLKSSHAASELNLGHLVHNADNFRGSLRGSGAELRTDAYGAVRARSGLLVSSYRLAHAAPERDPAGDNAAGIAMLKHAVKLGETYAKGAMAHQSIGFGVHGGSSAADKSVMDKETAPLKAMLAAVAGMVGDGSQPGAVGGSSGRSTAPDKGTVPHVADPIIKVAARGGLGVAAAGDLQLANGESVSLMSGQDSQYVTGGQLRVHSSQAIGMVGGLIQPGQDNIGLQLIAAQDDIDVQAQSDEIKVRARNDVDIISANAHIDWAAATSISLTTAGGANITIAGGNITVQCGGSIFIYAGIKDFTGPGGAGYPMPKLPVANPPEDLSNRLDIHDLFVLHEFGDIRYAARLPNKRVLEGTLDEHGRSVQIYAKVGEKIEILTGQTLDEWDLIYDYDDDEDQTHEPTAVDTDDTDDGENSDDSDDTNVKPE
ncbi:type VI secretion system tip protein VgrG [Massilia antarctica]|uniref:Type VI secretion system tip protein VgrG n=1 Tax=Massilia antarctica TaxID=2765360 RepID=A0AA49A7L3_9BURK|nr:type VI secretion system Vgr family protein [Massilia antarctica]QPI49231.1 type VI secretion system tip protein VgrG [Massilia antarctica]